MRWFTILLATACLVTGCSTSQPNAVAQEEAAPVWTEGSEPEPSIGAPSQDGQVIIPITSPTGIVATVNEPLRFVVLDYALTALPKMDQVLFIYRRGQKVAKVKVTGPFRGQTVAADIIEGIATEGDEVRAD